MDEYYRTSESGVSSPNMIDNSIAPVMKMLDWLVVLIIAIIPVANLIMFIVWAFGNTNNPNLRSFAKAFLVLIGLQLLVLAVFMGQFMGMLMKAMAMFG